MIYLKEYSNEQEKALDLIQMFWLCHNQETQRESETLNDLKTWTSAGHKLYFVNYNGQNVGFVHLGSRGGDIDWLEDIFVLPEYQNQGIGTKAIQLVEKLVKEYSTSLYIEAAARNEKAIRLYQKLGFDCLNTITIRKDFNDDYECIKHEKIYECNFEIRKAKGSEND